MTYIRGLTGHDKQAHTARDAGQPLGMKGCDFRINKEKGGHMMRRTMLAGMLLLSATGACQAGTLPAPAALSAAQRAVIDQAVRRIAVNEGRHMVEMWPDAKKVAEFMCAPAALPALQADKGKGVDRVFLGSGDDAQGLVLHDATRLTGEGQARVGNDWTNFTFECALNPENGKVSSFHANLAKTRAATGSPGTTP